MFSYKKKAGNNSGAPKSTDRLIRLLRSNTGLQASPIDLEGTYPREAYDENQEEAGSAMLEAKCRKADVVMAMQQHRSFC